MYLLGIDIGTSACKVTVFELDGTVKASAVREYPVYYPESGWAEQDPIEWYEAVCGCIREICNMVCSADIKAVGIDGQGWSCIPVDKNGNVLYHTPIWFDTRATEDCVWLKDNIGEDKIFEVSGNSIQPSYTTPKALWFKNNKHDIYDNTYKFLQSNSYIAYRLTGAYAQDKSMGYGHYFYNIKTCKYEIGLIEKMGLNSSHYPEIVDCHTVIGAVTRVASKETGLKSGTPVIIGGLDAACGTLGAGVYKPGQTQEQGGQAGGMSVCLDTPAADKRLILGNHVVPDLWLLQGGTVGGGGVMRWFREQFGEAFGGSLKDIDAAAKTINPASDGVIFLPYMNGERSPIWDINAKGVFFGLSFSKTRAHMARAVLEGVAYSLKHNLEAAKSAGAYVDRLYATGGAANSSLWMQIKSDVTGLPITVPSSGSVTALGAAILAGVGVGVYKNFDDAISKTVTFSESYEPNAENTKIYEKAYGKYLKIYEQLKDVMKQ